MLLGVPRQRPLPGEDLRHRTHYTSIPMPAPASFPLHLHSHHPTHTHRDGAGLELGQRVVKQLTALALSLLPGHVVALLDLLGAGTVVAARALLLPLLLRLIRVVLWGGATRQGTQQREGIRCAAGGV